MTQKTNVVRHSTEEWNVLVEATAAFLKEQAKLRRYTTYTELNAVLTQRTGERPFDFSLDRDRAAMGWLLGDVVDLTYNDLDAMLSSIVLYLNENDAGYGFYQLAMEKGLLPRSADKEEKQAFWISQANKVYAHFARPRRRRRTAGDHGSEV